MSSHLLGIDVRSFTPIPRVGSDKPWVFPQNEQLSFNCRFTLSAGCYFQVCAIASKPLPDARIQSSKGRITLIAQVDRDPSAPTDPCVADRARSTGQPASRALVGHGLPLRAIFSSAWLRAGVSRRINRTEILLTSNIGLFGPLVHHRLIFSGSKKCMRPIPKSRTQARFSAILRGVRKNRDCVLERSGFELSVPREPSTPEDSAPGSGTVLAVKKGINAAEMRFRGNFGVYCRTSASGTASRIGVFHR